MRCEVQHRILLWIARLQRPFRRILPDEGIDRVEMPLDGAALTPSMRQTPEAQTLM